MTYGDINWNSVIPTFFRWWPCREVLAELSPRPATSVCRLVLRVKSHKDHCISHLSWPLARHWWQGGDPATLDETRRRKKEIRSCHTLGGGPGGAFTWCHEVLFFSSCLSTSLGSMRVPASTDQPNPTTHCRCHCWHAYEGNELLLSSVHLLIHLPSHLKLLLAFHDYQMPGFIIVKFGHALASVRHCVTLDTVTTQAFCRVCMGQHVWVEFTPELLNQQIFRFSATQKFRFISIYFYIPFVCVYPSISVYVLHLSTFPE